MQKSISALLGLFFLLVAIPLAAAQEAKTIAVVSISSYTDVMDNVKLMGDMVGFPQLAQMAEGQIQQFTGGKGLAGLDNDKPIVFAVQLQGQESYPVVCVPVKDLSQLLGSLPGTMGQTEDLGEGVISLPNAPDRVVIKEQDGWAYVSNDKENLASVPGDPLQLAGDLPSKYMIAVQAFVQNMPEEMRMESLYGLEMMAKQGVSQAPGSEEERQLQKQILERQMARMRRLVTETEQVTLGLGTDSEKQSIFLEMTMTALADSSLAMDFSRMKKGPSKHSGLLADEAAINALAVVSGPPSDDDLALLDAQHKQARDRALAHLDGDSGVPDEVKPAIKEALGELLAVGFDTLKSGTFDAGMALFVNQKSTLVMGGYVADGNALEAAVKKLAQVVEADASLPPIQWDAENHQGYRFHTANMPTPDPQAAQFVGDQVEVALAISDSSCYLAVGGDATAQLKKAIDASAAGNGQEVEPYVMAVKLAPIATAAVAADPTGMAAQMADLLKDKGDIEITASSVPNGFTGRLEIEQNVLKAVGQMVPMMMTMMGGGGGGAPPFEEPPAGGGGDDPFGGF